MCLELNEEETIAEKIVIIIVSIYHCANSDSKSNILSMRDREDSL